MPVDLVFGLLSPENSGATHLHALAAISRLVRDERVHEALSEAPDAEALYGLLANARTATLPERILAARSSISARSNRSTPRRRSTGCSPRG